MSDRRSRRGFLRTCSGLGWGSLGVIGLTGTAATARFFFPRVVFEPPSAFVAGFPHEYVEGEVSLQFVTSQRVFLVRTRAGIYGLMAQCTHLGCTPTWFADERLFKCPCHGSNFNLDGDVVAGPAPEPLRRVALKLGEDGRVVVDRAVLESRPPRRAEGGFLLRL